MRKKRERKRGENNKCACSNKREREWAWRSSFVGLNQREAPSLSTPPLITISGVVALLPPLKINLLLLIEFFLDIYFKYTTYNNNPSVFYKSVIRTNGLTRKEKKDDANMMTTRERKREVLPLWQARPPYLEHRGVATAKNPWLSHATYWPESRAAHMRTSQRGTLVSTALQRERNLCDG